MKQTITLPEILQPLFEPKRYKILYGGRGGGKSWSVAMALLVLGAQKPLRILCAREYQNSIADSVHKLLADLISENNLDGFYEVQRQTIKGENGTEFIFEGLKHNIQSIKSKEGIDIVWCFVAGTLIDGVPIEDIQEGDYVNSFNHQTNTIERRRVVRTMKRKRPESIYKLLTEGNRYNIITTGEHPVYVKDKGYLPVKDIIKGDTIYAKETKPSKLSSMFRWVWGRVNNRYTRKTTEVQKERRNILLGLRKEKVVRTHEEQQSNEQSRKQREDEEGTQRSWSQTKEARRKWKGIYKGSATSIQKTWSWMVARVSSNSWSRKKSSWIPNSLQGRLSKHLLQASNRMRWQWTLWRERKERRREEKQVLREYRVDSVTLQEQEDIERLGLSDGGDYVYNFEVEVNNNYFANDVLVHNCEEAQTISKLSWEILIPTIREDDSEIWITFNPELETDETYQRFVIAPPSESWVQKVNYTDNPWFPEVLDIERKDLQKKDPDAYLNIWEGHCREALEGAVYAKELRRAQEEERITSVPYDARYPVSTYWDLGWQDFTAIWFVQKVGFEFRVIDYYENQFESIQHYVQELIKKPYVYDIDWLPHDGSSKSLGTGMSIKEQMQQLGRRVQTVPMMSLKNGIAATRAIFGSCFIDKEKCTDGLNALRHYRFDEKTTEPGQFSDKPLHDWSSHASDSFRYFAVASQKLLGRSVADMNRKKKPKVRSRRGYRRI